jgi:hypothetical protein
LSVGERFGDITLEQDQRCARRCALVVLAPDATRQLRQVVLRAKIVIVVWHCALGRHWLTPGTFGTSAADLDLANDTLFQEFIANYEVFANGILNVRECFVFRLALRPTPGQARAGNREALVRFC